MRSHRHPFVRHLARAVAVVALAVGGLAAPTTAAVAEAPAEEVFVGLCDFLGVEEVLVAAGAELVVLDGWAAGPRGSLENFLRSQQTTWTVQRAGAEPVSWDASGEWSAAERLKEERLWLTMLETELEPLAAGESVTVTRAIVLSKPINDIFFEDRGRPFQQRLPKGHTLTNTCTFTGRA